MVDATGMLLSVPCFAVFHKGKVGVLYHITYRRGVYCCSFRQEGNPKTSAVRRVTDMTLTLFCIYWLNLFTLTLTASSEGRGA